MNEECKAAVFQSDEQQKQQLVEADKKGTLTQEEYDRIVMESKDRLRDLFQTYVKMGRKGIQESR